MDEAVERDHEEKYGGLKGERETEEQRKRIK